MACGSWNSRTWGWGLPAAWCWPILVPRSSRSSRSMVIARAICWGRGRAFFRCSTATRKASRSICAAPRDWKWRTNWRHRPMWWCRTSNPGGWRNTGSTTLSPRNPRLILVNHSGFLPGPYEHRTALDEVVQMMGGLAYMTGRPGDPLRAGASVNDIMGGMFGALGAIAALMQRGITGRGQEVDSALFENNVFLVGQHMLQYAVTGQPAAPMPERISSWALYDVFSVKDGEQIFLAAVSDAQWLAFCDALGFADLKADPQLLSNNDPVRAPARLLPDLRQRRAGYGAGELAAIFEQRGLPFAPIARPEQLFDDPHLNATGGLADITLPDGERAGQTVRTALLPLRMAGQRLGVRSPPPVLGQHTAALMAELGYTPEQVQALQGKQAVA